MAHNGRPRLGMKAIQILQLLAIGQPVEQIMRVLGCQPADIQNAAAEALRVCNDLQLPSFSLPAIRALHPRAYEPWSNREDSRLLQLVAAGKSLSEIAQELQRQPSAIRSRLTKIAGTASVPARQSGLWQATQLGQLSTEGAAIPGAF